MFVPFVVFLKSLRRSQKLAVFLLLDIGLVPVALAAMILVQDHALAWADLLIPMILLTGIAGATSWGLGLPRTRLANYEIRAMGKNGQATLMLMLGFALMVRLFALQLPFGSLVVFGMLYFFLSVGVRLCLRMIVTELYRQTEHHRHVVIYGAGTTGAQLAQALASHENVSPVAFVDDNPALHGLIVAGLPVHPALRLEEITKSTQIDRVILAMPSVSTPKLMRTTKRLEKMGLEVHALPSFAQLIGEEALIDKLTPMSAHTFLGRAQLDQHLETGGDAYEGKTILISGAGGSIGSELCRQVLALRPAKLVLYELSELALYTVHQELEHLAFETDVTLIPILGSVTDPRQVRQVMEAHSPQIILHSAAYKHVPLVEANPLAGLANNVLGTRTLAQESLRAGAEKFILVSSDKAVRPTNVMGASKRLAEHVVQDLASRSDTTVFSLVRFGNVLGSSGSVVPLFQDQIARGGPVTITDPRMKRYFMTVNEAARLVLLSGSFAKGGEVFVLDMGKPLPVVQLARQVIESTGYSVRDKDNPEGDIEIVTIGLRPGEKLYEELMISEAHTTTQDEKILVAREDRMSEIQVASMLRNLRRAVTEGDVAAARATLQEVVEGYSQSPNQNATSLPAE